MFRSRMFWRLFAIPGVLLPASIGLLGMLIVQRVSDQYLHQIEGSLHGKVVLLREIVRGQDTRRASLQERVKELGEEVAARFTLIDQDGKVLADSDKDPGQMENHRDRPEVRIAAADRPGASTRFSATLHQSMMYMALPARDLQGRPVIVRAALSLTAVEDQLAGLSRMVWTTAGLTGLAALVLAFWLTRRITRPLQELTAGAERISAGEYGHKVYVTGSDEVGTLARAFNRMSLRLAGQFAQIDEDRQQLRAILSGMVEGVVALDARDQILFVNERAAQLLEFPTTSAVGRKLWEVARRPGLQQVLEHALVSPEPHQEELSWTGPEARTLTVHAARLNGASARGVILVLHDTTELRRLERLRQDFVANVSHELKTPLSVIKACVETLLDGAVDDPEFRGPFLEKISDQADRLHRLILDLLSLARIESGGEVFELRPVSLRGAVLACLERHRDRAEAKGHQLEAVEEGTPLPWKENGAAGAAVEVAAWADEEAVAEILDNLVDNAVKYTPAGGRIRVRWWAEDGEVCLEVEDTGIGIAATDLPRIFERFYRVDKARSRELGGTGLGLAIVKHLVQAMHGSVGATSKPGKGTRFSIRLPRPPGR